MVRSIKEREGGRNLGEKGLGKEEKEWCWE
jgi:hypothetical protein